jgi:two-component system chemotaxis response regulator CheB
MQENTEPELIIVVGASAGGLNAITELVGQFNKEWKAAVFIVVHLSKMGLGEFLIHRLQKYTDYSCSMARDGEKIEAGNIYLPNPDQHLIIKDGHIVLGEGPSENRWRPSIDVLFRSAAAYYTNKVVGIILTGFLNDGMSGMSAIQRSEGKTIVQDPKEAEYSDMPLAVLENMQVDYCVSLSQMGATIQQLVDEKSGHVAVAPDEVIREAEIAHDVVISIDAVSSMGDKLSVACPDCGGGLWHVEGDPAKHYRCHIGHSYSERDLIIRQNESLESTLWIALRIMEERRSLFKKIAKGEQDKGFNRLANEHLKKSDELEVHIDKLKQLLFSAKKS